MPRSRDSARILATPWSSFLLSCAGGATLAGAHEPVFRLLGGLLVLLGALLLVRGVRQVHALIDRVLAAIPFQDKSQATLDELPRAWVRLQRKVVDLEQAIVREDILRWNIVANLKAGLVLFRRDDRVRLFNPSARQLLGSSSQLAVGSILADVFREPESLRAMEQARAVGCTEWLLRRGGRLLTARAVPFQGDPEGPGEEDGLLVTLEDITRQEALETTRQKFISNASHELKTPTTSIRIAAEDLLEGQMVAPEGETSLRIILRSVDRMTMLLNDISELSRIETGALALAPQTLYLGTFVDDLVEDIGPAAQARGVQVLGSVPHGLEVQPFEADPYRLHQLLENLLSNAIKFSPEGGRVWLRVTREGSSLVWQVQDEGAGIPLQEQPRIFERFYRMSSSRAVPGTGLGLAIVKHLALLMGGEVAVESEPGRGATFTLRLPLVED